jgi:hypothetical protein
MFIAPFMEAIAFLYIESLHKLKLAVAVKENLEG